MRIQYSFLLIILLASCNDNSKPFHEALLSKKTSASLTGEEPKLGMGIRSMNNEETGVGIVYDSIVRSTDAKGGTTKAHAELVSSFQDLAQKSNLSIDMNFKLYGFKAEGSANFFKSFHYNTKSQYLFAECYIETPSKELAGYRFNDEAKKIAEQDVNKFYKLYGDEFVYKELRGGSLKLIFEFKSSNSLDEQSNSFSLNLTQKFFAGSCQLNTKYTSEYKKIEESSNIKVYIEKQGNYDEMPQFTFDGMAKEFQKFPTTINPDSGGYEVVTGIKTLQYQYAANKPNNIDQLGIIKDQANKYVEALNTRLCKLYESIGNINYIKLNKPDYSKKDVDSLVAYEPEVNKQIQETIDIYNTFKSTYQTQYTPTQIRNMSLAYVKVPENFTDDFLPDFTFGNNAFDTKIYLGKIITSHISPLTIKGQLNFLNIPQPENTFSFDPIFRDSWANEIAQKWYAIGFRGDQAAAMCTSPKVIPIHVYLNDFYTNQQIAEYIYENTSSITIPPGKYYLYVMIDPYGKLVIPRPNNWTIPGGTDPMLVKRPVISLEADHYLTMTFKK